MFSFLVTSAFNLAAQFNTELNHYGDFAMLNDCMARIQLMAADSDKDAQRLVTAGVVQDLIILLRRRAMDYGGLEIVLVTLGTLACVLMFPLVVRSLQNLTFSEL